MSTENCFADIVPDWFKEEIAEMDKDRLVKEFYRWSGTHFDYWDNNQWDDDFRENLNAISDKISYIKQELWNRFQIEDGTGIYSGNLQKQARYLRIQVDSCFSSIKLWNLSIFPGSCTGRKN